MALRGKPFEGENRYLREEREDSRVEEKGDILISISAIKERQLTG